MKTIIRIAGALLLALAGVAQAQNISIATGGTGGVYYPLGGGIAAVLSKHVPGMQATAEVTGGSVDNLQADRHRQALHRASRMADAAHGRAARARTSSRASKVPLRTLMVLYPNRMHVVSDRGHRHHQDGRPEGQARLHRLAAAAPPR